MMKTLIISVGLLFLTGTTVSASIPRTTKVSDNDTTAGYLNGKLVAGAGISFTENNNGADETLTIASTVSGAPASATYITQTANGTLSNEQALSALTTGLVKVTNATGVLSTASAGSDYQAPLTSGVDYLAPNGDGSGLSGVVTSESDPQVGALTNGKWCTSNGASITCSEDAPAGSGDVTGVGDCTGGACLDGSSDGGTNLALYDGNSHKTTITAGDSAGDLAFTLPTTDGDANQVLKTDGSGVLSWVAQGGFDATTLDAVTWSDGANASNAWTFDVSGTDHTMTAGNGVMTFSHNLTVTGDLTVSGDDITMTTNTSGAVLVADGNNFNPVVMGGDASIGTDGSVVVANDSHAHTSTTLSGIDIGDDTNLAAGRSLTLSGDSVEADSELYTDSKCLYFESPTAADDFKSIWYTAIAVTITKIWAESDQTVTFMLQVDDGSPADVDSVDLAPAAGTATDTSLNGDATMAAGDRLDLDLVSVANTPTWCSICWEYTKDD
jgi:hypothetical protein